MFYRKNIIVSIKISIFMGGNALSRVIRVRYEKGVLKPLEPLNLREDEVIRIELLPDEFPDLVDKVDSEARSDINKVLREARERWKRWF